ncbi:centromere protein m [Anaeramoeba flamelloides]|uniref:Centromere protein M n=1 Tax=Anaeramoeba flamelloides TaxID=1746091 RepID=A0AAV7YZC7_9EUKA|nr:centromere protein m [Anaeramoeba flamelloides]
MSLKKTFQPLSSGKIYSTILLAGVDEEQKNKLSQSISKIAPKEFGYSVHIRSTSLLPLVENKRRPKIDFILFVINSENLVSFNWVVETLPQIDLELLSTGNVCIWVDDHNTKNRAVSFENITEIATTYSIPIISCLSEEDLENETIKVCKLIENSILFLGGGLLFKCLEFETVPSTLALENI